ncbi:CHAT domain-containing protein [Nocardia sp. XZ_19_369]|uniref:CHAT domain-containing protein n=1 Tax=Nocardia sp. XZ_19_369 TaxID=2769487 RepID=UPI00188E9224|nr:CHAT domain-containing protein [Nocardia sp. XZ_19_369]
MFKRKKSRIDPVLVRRVEQLRQQFTLAEGSDSLEQARATLAELNLFVLEFVPTMGSDLRKALIGTEVLRWAIILETRLPECNWFRVAMMATMHSGAYAQAVAQFWQNDETQMPLRAANQLVFELGAYANHRCSMPAFAPLLLENVSGSLYLATQVMTAIRAVDPDPRRLFDVEQDDQRWVADLESGDFWDHQDRDTRVINRRLEEFRARQVKLVEAAPPHRSTLEADVRHCVTEVAAIRSGRDIVYVVATPLGGAAFRTFGDTARIGRTVSVDLPRFTSRQVQAWQARIADLYQRREGAAALHKELSEILTELGAATLAEIRTRWPDLRAFALAPVGAAAALPFGGALVDGQPAQLQFDMTVVPDASIFLTATLHPRPASRAAVVVVDPLTGADFLPEVGPEGDAIAAIHQTHSVNSRPNSAQAPDDEPMRIRALAPSRQREIADGLALYPAAPHPDGGILDGIERAAIVHLACYGVLVEEPVFNSVLLLGENPVSLSEFLIRPVAPGGVIVLSACDVGGVVTSLPNELLGFPAVFLSAGARTVIASALPVIDSRATITFLEDLHRGLRAGEEGHVALRSAISASYARGDRSFVWAGFTAYGA